MPVWAYYSTIPFLLLQQIVCPTLDIVDIVQNARDKMFGLSPFSDTCQPNKRFINIENYVFGHWASLYEVPFYESLCK